jgi:hypothetical protein
MRIAYRVRRIEYCVLRIARADANQKLALRKESLGLSAAEWVKIQSTDE